MHKLRESIRKSIDNPDGNRKITSMNIYYFSGTGNSFYAAKSIARHLKDAGLHSIFDSGRRGVVSANGSELAIVFPFSFYGIPSIVRHFIDRLDPRITRFISFI